jgi:hypothetical protein
MNAVDVIDRAIEAVSEGWHQGDFYNPRTGGVCLVGGLYKGAGMGFNHVGSTWDFDFSGYDQEAYVSAHEVLRSVVKDETGLFSVPDFNDSSSTTKEDVLLILKKARAELDV